jgi:hypothetical protein
MAVENLDAFSDDAALNKAGVLVDISGDLNDESGATRAVEWCEAISKRPLSSTNGALLEYFWANAWENRRRAKHVNRAAAWNWEQPELLNQILHLRRAIQHVGYNELDATRRCQIQTNLGNQLSITGRFVEAQQRWNLALKIDPHFGMALGNRGRGLMEYARSLYDRGHRGVFLAFAHRSLTQALSQYALDIGQDGGASASFAEAKAQIETTIDAAHLDPAGMRMDDDNLGRSVLEREYRQWALDEVLFLNPLNDLGAHTIAARDVFTLPDFMTPIDESPTLVGLFNQMKQEFVSARWLLFESLHAGRPHFSDREVLLYNTLDYPSYCLSVEKTKAAYRIAYSLLDKIAFFLNDYARLKIDPKRVYFKSVWYQKADAQKRIIRPELVQLENWPLRGLFWLSKDFFEPDLQDVMEPDAQALYVIRNCLEHSYLKVHEMRVPHLDSREFWKDRLAYSVQRNDFEAKTLTLMKTARAAMIYLSLGMHREERRRDQDHGKPVVPMPLDVWRD